MRGTISGMTNEKETIITGAEIKDYIAPLAARGSGRVRSSSVGETVAAWDNENITLDVKEANYGLYQILLTGAKINTVVSAMPLPESISDEDFKTYKKQEVLRIFNYGTLELSDDLKYLTASSQNFFGGSYATLTFDEMKVIVKSETSDIKGSCLVCKGTEFVLSSFGSIKIKAVSENSFESTAPASLSMRPGTVYIRCASCNTPHKSQERGVGFTLDGKSSKRPTNAL